MYDTYNELYLDGVIKQRSHHWVTEKPTIPWRTFANHWCGVTSFEHLPVLPRRAASTASPWPMPWPSVEQKPSFPHCAEAQRNCSLIVAWHGPTRPMISNDHLESPMSPWKNGLMQTAWCCSIKGWGSRGGHATRFLFRGCFTRSRGKLQGCRSNMWARKSWETNDRNQQNSQIRKPILGCFHHHGRGYHLPVGWSNLVKMCAQGNDIKLCSFAGCFRSFNTPWTDKRYNDTTYQNSISEGGICVFQVALGNKKRSKHLKYLSQPETASPRCKTRRARQHGSPRTDLWAFSGSLGK